MIGETEFPALKQRCRLILTEDMHVTEISEDDDGDFIFGYDGNSFLLVFDTKDPAFVWMHSTALYRFEEEELPRVDRCITETNSLCKCVKLMRSRFVLPDGTMTVHATVSFLATDVVSLSGPLFERYLFQIEAGACKFDQFMKQGATEERAVAH